MSVPNPVIVDMDVVINDLVVPMDVAVRYELPIELGTLEADHNGSYTAPAGTAWDTANVSVPAVEIESLRATHNGIYTPEPNKAFGLVSVNVPNPSSGSISIGQNGIYDVTEIASAIVDVANSYSSDDNGKVVSNGALVAQTDETVTTNGVVNTTTVKQVTVNVQEAEDKDINFYDVDGFRLFSYTREEFAALSALPTAPNRPDLFLNFTMWNWTKAEIDAQPGYVEVGALYDLTDCDFALVVEPTVAAQKDATLRFYTGSGNTVELDWGDGSAVETYNASSSQIVATHTWPELGRRYRIKLTRTAGTSQIIPGGSANTQLLYGEHNDHVAQSTVREAYVGSNCRTNTALCEYAFFDRIVYCTNAEKNTQLIYTTHFLALSRKSNYTTSVLANADSSRSFICPAGNSFLPFSAADGFRRSMARKLTIPNGVTSIGQRCIMNNINLQTLHIPGSVTTIAASAISNENMDGRLRFLWFHGTTPPVLSASNSLTLYAYTTIFIPFSAIAAYLTGTNYPSPATNQYIGFATYASGAALPTTDPTDGYTVTWYASIADAAAGVHPIAQGNGKRIYCIAEEAAA